jgi:hypothetical protein
MNQHSPYELARIADCLAPESDDSPGAKFLLDVSGAVAELGHRPDRAADLGIMRRIACEAVPVHDVLTLWRIFVDLGAFREDDKDKIGRDAIDAGCPEHYAAAMLYQIAYRLAYRLVIS